MRVFDEFREESHRRGLWLQGKLVGEFEGNSFELDPTAQSATTGASNIFLSPYGAQRVRSPSEGASAQRVRRRLEDAFPDDDTNVFNDPAPIPSPTSKCAAKSSIESTLASSQDA